MIVQDEEVCVQRAIDSVKDYVDEIIILDGGSNDKTREICLSNEKVKLFNVPFNPIAGDSFATQKNNAIEKASNEWIWFIDADEYYNDYVGQSLQYMIDPNMNDGVDCYAFSRKTFIDGRLMNITNQDWQYRLFKNYCRFHGVMHEGVVGFNKNSYCNLDIMHYKTTEWQHKDNERVWNMGQEPPEGWIKFNGKWEWLGNGYSVPDTRFWSEEEKVRKSRWYTSETSRELYNTIMPIEQPELPIEGLGYSPGEILIRDTLSEMTGINLLDIGCANGRFGIVMMRENRINSLTGIDISDEEIIRAKATAINAGVDATFIRSAIEEFQPQQRYNVVAINETLEHLYNPLMAVRYIIDNFMSKNAILVGNVPYIFECNCEHHLHYFSMSSLRQFFEQFFNDVLINKKNYYDNIPDHYPEYHLTFICRDAK
jgi:hypothetical protein